MICCAYMPFVDLICPFCGGAYLLSSMLQHYKSLPDVVFLDLGALPWGPGSSKYWEGWRTTHVFFCLGEDADAAGPCKDVSPPWCPPGWSFRLVFLGHWEAGRATLGPWSVAA
jgi:hypothetical protein